MPCLPCLPCKKDRITSHADATAETKSDSEGIDMEPSKTNKNSPRKTTERSANTHNQRKQSKGRRSKAALKSDVSQAKEDAETPPRQSRPSTSGKREGKKGAKHKASKVSRAGADTQDSSIEGSREYNSSKRSKSLRDEPASANVAVKPSRRKAKEKKKGSHSSTSSSKVSEACISSAELVASPEEAPTAAGSTTKSFLRSSTKHKPESAQVSHESYVLKGDSPGDNGNYGLALQPLAEERPTYGAEKNVPDRAQEEKASPSSRSSGRHSYVKHDDIAFERVIGEGAFGRTWLGKLRHRKVAIKEVQPRALVDESWDAIEGIAEQVGGLFYAKLFEIAPEVRELFPEDMKRQQVKLMKLLGTAVGSLRDLPSVLGTVQQLGRNHVDYGVEPAMYDAVATALLSTLETGLGDAWTVEVKNAWVNAFTLVSGVMKDAMEDELRQRGELQCEDRIAETAKPAGSLTQTPVISETHCALLAKHVAVLRPVTKRATELFYTKLFEAHPEYEALFPRAFVRRRGKIVKMLSTVVKAQPNRIELVTDQLRELGSVHGNLKVTTAMMGPTRDAFFRMLEEELGKDEWTQNAIDAWSAVFDFCGYYMAPGLDSASSNSHGNEELISQADIERVQSTWAKVMPPAKTESITSSSSTIRSGAVQDLLQEANLLLNLPWHENVTQTIGICDSPILMIMEYCDGGSLEDLLHSDSSQAISINDKIGFLREIALGCEHLNHHGIIHRDLAARNILLVKRGRTYTCKVADFGMSRQVGEQTVHALSDADSKQLGVYCVSSANGPLKHLAPEVYAPPHVFSIASDVWAYGVLAVEIWTNDEPFPDVTATEFGSRADEFLPQMAQQIPSNVPGEVASLISSRVLEMDPKKRATFDEILDNLPEQDEFEVSS